MDYQKIIEYSFDRLSRCTDSDYEMSIEERKEMLLLCKLLHSNNRLAPVLIIDDLFTYDDEDGNTLINMKIATGHCELKKDDEYFWAIQANGWNIKGEDLKDIFIKVKITESTTPNGLPLLNDVERWLNKMT